MEVRPIAIGVIIFGVLAIGGTIDGLRRKIAAQPDWVAMNWKSVLMGAAAWIAVGLVAVLGGVAALFV